ncbi:hypothetical protein [Akkermansia muciniphila]|uniref:hypothetical protein n=1 Tax=Akkermansia muciniphila TaxID=239935 RepID=UPI000C9D0A58|nr:hypothetical protein [Akkermansia muciniphila]PNC91002.1 hypothetical protein CXT91_09250 [Akkermansia muciniphila]
MKILYVIFAVWVFISGVSFARTECSVKSDKILNIHFLNECDFKMHLHVSSDEWCRLVIFIHPKDKIKKNIYPRFVTQYFLNKDAINIAKSLEKCAKWADIVEDCELATNKFVASYYAPLEKNPRKYSFDIYFISMLNESKSMIDVLGKTSSHVQLFFNDPKTGKFSIRMSIEDAKELASMFRVVPNLEKQAKEKVVKADTILK